ncbi:MAG: tetratricopeptide repeat protein [Bryobacteraceae bacterium]
MSRFVWTTALVCLAVAQAQIGPPGTKVIRGEVNGVISGDFVNVELHLEGRFTDKAQVMPDGTFEFKNVTAGHYEVRLTDSQGNILRREWMNIGDFTGPLTLRLERPKQQAKPAGSVSLKRLAAPPPAAARKELSQAQKALSKGREDEAMAHLRKALEIHPEFMEARNNLGVRLMQRRDYAGAHEEFRKAAAIDPTAAPVNANLALALIHLNRHAEAEAPARAAVRAEPDNPAANYALGVSMAVNHRPIAEALAHLRIAAGRFPHAHLALAYLLSSSGRNAEAAGALRAYLETANPPQRERVQSWLDSLGKAPVNALR